MSDGALFLLGLLGGVVAELVAVTPYRRRTAKQVPAFLRGWLYWVIGVLWIVVGGIISLVMLREVENFGPILPVQVGATAPLLFERLLASAPDNAVGKTG